VKYDDACEAAAEATGASLLLLLVVGGSRGSGFSTYTVDPQLLDRLPGLLRFIADEINAGGV
jgi:hypothetical protein